MSQENVEVVGAWLAAWNRNDWDGMERCFAADCEIYAPEGWPESGPFKGWPSFRRGIERIKDSWESERVEVDELRDLGERVLARWRWLTVGKQSGIASESQVTAVSTLREGKIIRVDYFFDHAKALEAAGLSE
jgi:ketosteroid isomerase-like protein